MSDLGPVTPDGDEPMFTAEDVRDARIEGIFNLAAEIRRAPSRFTRDFVVENLADGVADLSGVVDRLREQLAAANGRAETAEHGYAVWRHQAGEVAVERDLWRERTEKAQAALVEMTRCRNNAMSYAEREHVPLDLGDNIDTDGTALMEQISDVLSGPRWEWEGDSLVDVVADVLQVVRPHLARFVDQACKAEEELKWLKAQVLDDEQAVAGFRELRVEKAEAEVSRLRVDRDRSVAWEVTTGLKLRQLRAQLDGLGEEWRFDDGTGKFTVSRLKLSPADVRHLEETTGREVEHRLVGEWHPAGDDLRARLDGLTSSIRDRIEAEIRPAMLLGLQDAELHGEPGAERINQWVDWIADKLTGTPDTDSSQEETPEMTDHTDSPDRPG